MLPVLALVVLVLSAASIARAEDTNGRVVARLDWAGAADCLDAPDLVARVDAQLGREAFGERADVIVVGRSRMVADTVEVELLLTTPDGTRLGVRTLRTSAASCRALDEELALVVALLIDLPEEDIALLIPPPEPAAPLPPDPSEPAPDSPPPRSVRPGVWAGATGTLDALPGFAVALRAGAEIAPIAELPIEVGVAFFLPSSAARDGGGASFSAWSIRVGACLEAHVDVLALGGCAGVDVGAIEASGFGLDVALHPTQPWADVSIAARIAVRLGPVELRLQPGVLVPLFRDAFAYFDGRAVVLLHQSASVVPALDLIVAVHFDS